MSSVFGLKARPSSADLLAHERAEVLLELGHHAPLLQLVDLDHRVEQLEVVARVAGELLERGDVLREAGAAEADPGLQELRADPVVEAHALGDLDHVGAGLLADVGDLVDERDLRGQERVGGELDHLGALDVRAHERRVERRVEVDDRVAGPVAVVADDDAVRVQEVLDRRALLEELGAGDVGEALALLGEQPLDRRAGADRARSTSSPARGGRRRASPRRRRARRRGRRRPSRSAACRRRRTAGARARARRARSVEKCRRSRWRSTSSARPGLPDRDAALLEALDLGLVDVDAPDVVAELGEAGGGDQADVARADDPDGLSVRGMAHERPRQGIERALLLEPRERLGDREHLALVERLRERVRDPVHGPAGLPRDQPQPAAVVVELELAAAGRRASRPGCRGSAGPSRSCPGRRSTRRRGPWRPRAGRPRASCPARRGSCRSRGSVPA